MPHCSRKTGLPTSYGLAGTHRSIRLALTLLLQIADRIVDEFDRVAAVRAADVHGVQAYSLLAGDFIQCNVESPPATSAERSAVSAANGMGAGDTPCLCHLGGLVKRPAGQSQPPRRWVKGVLLTVGT